MTDITTLESGTGEATSNPAATTDRVQAEEAQFFTEATERASEPTPLSEAVDAANEGDIIGTATKGFAASGLVLGATANPVMQPFDKGTPVLETIATGAAIAATVALTGYATLRAAGNAIDSFVNTDNNDLDGQTGGFGEGTTDIPSNGDITVTPNGNDTNSGIGGFDLGSSVPKNTAETSPSSINDLSPSVLMAKDPGKMSDAEIDAEMGRLEKVRDAGWPKVQELAAAHGGDYNHPAVVAEMEAQNDEWESSGNNTRYTDLAMERRARE